MWSLIFTKLLFPGTSRSMLESLNNIHVSKEARGINNHSKTDVNKCSFLHSRYYFLDSTFMTKPGPEISCASVLNASETTEDVTGLANWDMQRCVMFYCLCFLVLQK